MPASIKNWGANKTRKEGTRLKKETETNGWLAPT